MALSRINSIGLIVEDQSDFDTMKVLLNRMLSRPVSIKQGGRPRGSGRLRGRAHRYAHELAEKNCQVLIVVHDRDREDQANLYARLKEKVADWPGGHSYICIPVEEIEAWLISDASALKTSFNLQKAPKEIARPETIASPKEHLKALIKNEGKVYLSGAHNPRLATHLNLDLVASKCPSFLGLRSFVQALP